MKTVIRLYPTDLVDYKPTLLTNKHSYEMIISLFTQCNMKCLFCADRLRDTQKPTKQGFQLRLDNVEKLLAVGIVHQPHINVKLFGGELFQDRYDQSIFDLYQWFVDQLNDLFSKYNKTGKLFISSNFVFNKNRRLVLDFLKRNNADIRCSFDLWGRFTKDIQLRRFVDNVLQAKQQGLEPKLAIILTNSNIDAIIGRSGRLFEIFDDLYNKQIYSEFDYYDRNDTIINSTSTTTIVDAQWPSDQKLFTFLKFLYTHYPNVEWIQSLLSDNSEKHCCHGATITDQLYYQCCDLSSATDKVLNQRQCYLCQYYQKCAGLCNRVFYNAGSDCHLQMFYDWLKAKTL